MYSAGEIQSAIKRQRDLARDNERVSMRNGCKRLQIDSVLYHNARIQNQRDYGVRDCWKEQEFVRDMEKRHPEIKVKNIPRKAFFRVDAATGPGGRGRLIPNLGRVTFHKVY